MQITNIVLCFTGVEAIESGQKRTEGFFKAGNAESDPSTATKTQQKSEKPPSTRALQASPPPPPEDQTLHRNRNPLHSSVIDMARRLSSRKATPDAGRSETRTRRLSLCLDKTGVLGPPSSRSIDHILGTRLRHAWFKERVGVGLTGHGVITRRRVTGRVSP